MESDTEIPIRAYRRVPIRIVRAKKSTDYYLDHLGLRLNRQEENLLRQRARRFVKLKRRRLVVAMVATLLIGSTVLACVFSSVDQMAVYAESTLSMPMENGWQAVQKAKTALTNEQFNSAIYQFQTADGDFEQAYNNLQMSGQVSDIMPLFSANYQTVSTVQALLVSAKNLCQAGIVFSQMAAGWSNEIKNLPKTTGGGQFSGLNLITSQLLSKNQSDLQDIKTIRNYLDNAQQIMNDYASQPVGNRALELARQKILGELSPMETLTNNLSDVLTLLPEILGQNKESHYLVEFLNNTELRPGGGFLGSYATVSFKGGQINGFAIQTNIYKMDNSFTKSKQITPPAPITKIISDWAMRDSNWSVNFPDAAAKTAWFFQQEGGGHLDGVIAIDTTFISDLLKITGPISISNPNMTVTADNFASTIQDQVEVNYWNQPGNQANEPKSVLADLFPLMLTKVFDQLKQHPAQYLKVLSDGVNEKHLLVSFLTSPTNQLNAKLRLDDALPASGDFLEISNANLGGLKSSLEIKQNVKINLSITNHNTIKHTVVINRQHTGTNTWPDGNNDNYIRVAVPRNAILDSAISNGNESGIPLNLPSVEVFNNYQTFGLWLSTPVQQTRSATFVYETPIDQPLIGNPVYHFQWIKQPGWLSDSLSIQFNNGGGWHFQLSDRLYNNPAVSTNQWWTIGLKNQNSLF